MNKTVTVNLGGTVFHIDDNAYDALIRYLSAIKSHFSAEQGRDEIMQDIESRIGEMFRERLKEARQVITLTDVDEVTLQMGRPEEFGGEQESAKENAAEAIPPSQPYKRRMFRDPDNKLLGGVCGGIAAYFDIDPVWIRLAFAVSFFLWGTGFMLYIILWIILPEAKTTADKLMMKGEAVTVSNIEKNVREELESVKQRLNESGKSGSVIGRIFEGIGEVFKFIFLFIGKVIAVFFIFIGLAVAFAMFASLFGLAGAPFVHYPGFIDHIFASRATFGWTFFGIVLVIGIPFLMLAYGGAKLLFNIKRGSKIVGLSALGLWIIGIVIVLLSGLKTAKEFSQRDNYRKEITLQQPPGKYFLITTDETKNREKDYDDWHNNNSGDDWNMETVNDRLISNNVKLDIVKSPTDSFDLVEIVYSRGPSRKAAIDNATRINYSFTQADSVIRLSRSFSMDKDAKWRAQKVQLLLRVPVGGKVRFDESMRGLIYDIENVENIYDSYMINRTWEMTPKGLSCVDCTGDEKMIGGRHMSIPGAHGEDIIVDENGVLIDDHKGNKVSVDSTGVHVRSEGKDVVKIRKRGTHIQ